LAEPQILHTVRADSVGNGRAVIPKKRRHVLLRQPLTSNVVAATPGAASDQGVGQRPQGYSTNRRMRPNRYKPVPGLLPEQPRDDGV
jgi:hypothetical protein